MKLSPSSKLDKLCWSPVTSTDLLEQAGSSAPMFGHQILFVSLSNDKAVSFQVADPRDVTPQDATTRRLLFRTIVNEGQFEQSTAQVEELKTKWEGRKTEKLVMVRAPVKTILSLLKHVHHPEALPWIYAQLGKTPPILPPKFDPFDL